MMLFDRTLTYQFALFLDEDHQTSLEWMSSVPDVLSRKVDGAPSLGLKFGPPEPEQALVLQAGGIAPANALTWKSSVWRLVCTPARLDLYFDARGYSEVRETSAPEVSQVSARVVPNLADVPSQLTQKVKRTALIVTAKRSSDLSASTDLVARTFLRIEPKDVSDVVVRLNHGTSWKLDDIEVLINRNETASSLWTLRNGMEETTLSWMFDVNTSPKSIIEFRQAGIIEFFHKAVGWIADRLTNIGAT